MNLNLEAFPMTPYELLQLEALSRGQTVDALKDEYRRTDTPIGEVVAAIDLVDLQALAWQWMA